MAKSSFGRRSIFRNKDLTRQKAGHTTRVGTARFEAARVRLKILAVLYGVQVEKIGDGDVIEFLARGEANTRAYLAGKSV